MRLLLSIFMLGFIAFAQAMPTAMPYCQPKQLSLHLATTDYPGMSKSYSYYLIANRSATPCWLQGRPQINQASHKNIQASKPIVLVPIVDPAHAPLSLMAWFSIKANSATDPGLKPFKQLRVTLPQLNNKDFTVAYAGYTSGIDNITPLTQDIQPWLAQTGMIKAQDIKNQFKVRTFKNAGEVNAIAFKIASTPWVHTYQNSPIKNNNAINICRVYLPNSLQPGIVTAKGCRVNNHGSLAFYKNFQQLIPPKPFYWADPSIAYRNISYAQGDGLPLRVGYEVNGGVTYICRGMYQDKMLMGKMVNSQCVVLTNNNEKNLRHFEVLS